ncbi:Major facilitator superfamily domain general substrate transporter [Penicillium coprophilum]|uniref:Major facilitator superfamily domain general substrate transporter n=1 Tax=Penicillium coprophilum TaxID=36646 RepID=UPI0023A28196|nr:Major facilitator superfamily domain general substrate transporter [Penicillium coprophilum]KAJ5164906.1 Major facilitator superfamily domain general substrate transporter [Penicillium coprophilum]
MVFARGDVSGHDDPVIDHQDPSKYITVVSWDGPRDPGNPYNWSLCEKWLLTALAVFATFMTMINGTIFTVAHETMNERFHISDASFPHSYWPVTSWAVGGGCFSLLVLPLMEDFGVRLWHKNFYTLVITRFFAGGCVSILANTSGTVIGNVWDTERNRNVPVSLFIVAYLSGSSIGPVIGAAIYQALTWRWIGYIQLMWYGAFFPLYFFLFKECRGIAILGQRAKALRREGKNAYTQHEIDTQGQSILSIVGHSASRPLFLFFTESVVFVSTLWSAFTVGTLYLFTQSVEQVFAELYDWTPSQAGYVQAAVVIGELLGWVITLFSGKLYFDSASRNKEIPGTPIPEARLYLAIVGGIFGISGGMFTYAWTSYPNFPWIAPAIGLAMVGAGSVIVVTGISDYVVDAYSKYAGSCMGIIATGENTLAAFLPLATMSMYSHLGLEWASTVLAFIALVLSFAPILVLIWGKDIRARSPFMKEAMVEKRRKSIDSV